MQIDLDAKVITRDGKEGGRISRVVFDPRSQDISAVVVSTGGLFGKDVLVSREELDRATRTGGRIHLEITKEQLDSLLPINPVDYAVPPLGWVPPVAMGYPGSAYLWPAAAAPAAYENPGQTRANRSISVSKGDTVQDRDGDDIGVVEDLRLDPNNGGLLGIVVRKGNALQTLFGGGQTVEIPGGAIGNVDQDVIQLNIDKDDLRHAA